MKTKQLNRINILPLGLQLCFKTVWKILPKFKNAQCNVEVTNEKKSDVYDGSLKNFEKNKNKIISYIGNYQQQRLTKLTFQYSHKETSMNRLSVGN